MKKVNVKDLTKDQIIYKATKFFTDNKEIAQLGIWIVKTTLVCCGFETVINDYRRAYAVEQALEDSDNEASFIQQVMQDSYNSNIAQASDYVDSVVELSYEERQTVKRFLSYLVPDVKDETGARQTLLD